MNGGQGNGHKPQITTPVWIGFRGLKRVNFLEIPGPSAQLMNHSSVFLRISRPKREEHGGWRQRFMLELSAPIILRWLAKSREKALPVIFRGQVLNSSPSTHSGHNLLNDHNTMMASRLVGLAPALRRSTFQRALGAFCFSFACSKLAILNRTSRGEVCLPERCCQAVSSSIGVLLRPAY